MRQAVFVSGARGGVFWRRADEGPGSSRLLAFAVRKRARELELLNQKMGGASALLDDGATCGGKLGSLLMLARRGQALAREPEQIGKGGVKDGPLLIIAGDIVRCFAGLSVWASVRPAEALYRSRPRSSARWCSFSRCSISWRK